MLSVVLLFMLMLSIAEEEIIDYCKLKCEGVKAANTLCKNTCHPHKNVKIINPDFDWRNRTLYWHNYYRNLIASGGDTRGGNSAASNMYVMNYDMGLEFTVACWIYSHGAIDYDQCAATPRFESVGQNLYSGHSGKVFTSEGIQWFFWNMWYNEDITLTNANIIDNYTHKEDKDKHYGHFTQLIWWNSAFVGCARCRAPFRYPDGSVEYDDKYFLVGCNYGPSGNFENYPVYKRGPSASACENNAKPNKLFPALCGEIAPWGPEAYYVGIPEMEERFAYLNNTGKAPGNRKDTLYMSAIIFEILMQICYY